MYGTVTTAYLADVGLAEHPLKEQASITDAPVLVEDCLAGGQAITCIARLISVRLVGITLSRVPKYCLDGQMNRQKTDTAVQAPLLVTPCSDDMVESFGAKFVVINSQPWRQSS